MDPFDVKPKVHATSPCEASESWPLSKVILGGFGAGGTAALLGLLFPQLAGLVYLGSKAGNARGCSNNVQDLGTMQDWAFDNFLLP